MKSVTASDVDFTEFYSAHFHEVARQLYVYLDDRAEAQDIAQEAFSRAYSRWREISGFEHPLAWVRQVAWRLATSRLRHLRVVWRYRAGLRTQHVEGPDPDRVALVVALKALPPNHRLAVVLHHLEQLSSAEIAEQRGVAEGTVRSWLSRGRAQLASQLAEHDWQQVRQVRFSPEETAAIAREAEAKARKRLRQSALAAAVAVLLAVAAAVVLAKRDGTPPVIDPTPSPSVEMRPIGLGGNGLDGPSNIRFVDADHAWLLYLCDRRVQGSTCPPTYATTDDGGRNWREFTAPPLEEDNEVFNPYVIDADTMVLGVTDIRGNDRGYWLTKDRGRTFTWHELKNPPSELFLRYGGYRLLCPDQAVTTEECQVRTLTRPGASVTQPPLRGNGSYLWSRRADGRLWVLEQDRAAEQYLFAVSDDGARTWRQLPAISAAYGELDFSPDGSDVWFVGTTGLWQLDGDQWRQRTKERPSCDVALIARAQWVTCRDGAVGFLAGGVFTPAFHPAEIAAEIRGFEVLGDGTIVVGLTRGLYLGLGTGTQRRWVHLPL